MDLMNIAQAYELARDLHDGQLDKAGQPYFEHVYRVAERVRQLPSVSDNAVIAAVLHDVVEDGKASLVDLLDAGVPPGAVMLVRLLSRKPDQPYAEYLERLAANYLAWQIKLADIADNMDPLRLAALPNPVRRRLREKYNAALDILIP